MRRIGLTLALGGLLVVVDTTVTVVAVPAMVAGLGSTLAAVQWVTTGYLLGIVAVIPVAGWAANRFGARRVYLVALLAFTLFSALAGLAWSVASLAVLRVLQGLGGGLLSPVGQAIGLRAVPRDQRGRLMALLGLPLIVGPVLGPPLAGYLIDAASWRWIFLLNVPIGLLAALLVVRLLPADDPAAAARQPIDWPGLAQLSAGAALVVLGCTMPAPPAVLAALLTAGFLLLFRFVRRARRVPAPLLDLTLLRHRPFATGTLVLTTFGAGYFGSLTVLPVFVQGVRGDPAALAGILVIPVALTVGLTVQVATRLVDRVPARRITLTGTSLGLAGALTLLVSTVTNAPYPAVVAGAVLLGAGSGATILPTMTVALRDLETTAVPRGTTLLALTQQLSAAVGGAVIAALLTLTVSLTPTAGVAAMLALTDPQRAAAEDALAAAVGIPYALVALLMLAALMAALRSSRPSAQPTPPTPHVSHRR
jgi:EmrB/QacA subfamily drug resistance transporter